MISHIPQRRRVIRAAHVGGVISVDQDAFCVWGLAKGLAQTRDEARARLDRQNGGVSDRFRRRPRLSAMVSAVPWSTRWPA